MSTKTILIIDGFILAVAGAVQVGLADPTIGLHVSESLRAWVSYGTLIAVTAGKYLELTLGGR